MMFTPSDLAGNVDVVMQLAFNGHPAVVKFKRVPSSYLEVMSKQCGVWYKKIVQMYMDWYK